MVKVQQTKNKSYQKESYQTIFYNFRLDHLIINEVNSSYS